MKDANKGYKKLRIFLASPGDVANERARLHAVAAEFNRTGSGVADWLGVNFEVLDWRTHVAPFMGRPEEQVLRQLPVEVWDIFVGILWLRFGTPTGAINPQTAQPFDSGTEEEFSLAYKAWEKNDCPKILFYRCLRNPNNLLEIDPDQLDRINKFFKKFDPNASHPGLYKPFHKEEEFEQFVREDLTKLLFEFSRADKMSCNLCGSIRSKSTTTHIAFNYSKPIIVKNVPADICERCGDRYFDLATIKLLQEVIWSKRKAKGFLKVQVYDFASLTQKPSPR